MKKVTSRNKVIYALKSYHQLKANIEVSRMNIEFLESELDKVKQGGITLVEYDDIIHIAKNCFDYMYMSRTEKEVFYNETIKYADKENLNKRIKHEEGLLYYNKNIVNLIETSINTLINTEKYIIELLYLSLVKYKWTDIQTNFNKHFRTGYNIETLQRYRDNAMEKLVKTMGNNYLINYLF